MGENHCRQDGQGAKEMNDVTITLAIPEEVYKAFAAAVNGEVNANLLRHINKVCRTNHNHPRVITCKFCGKTFETSNSKRKYCSGECLKAYNRAQARKAWKEKHLPTDESTPKSRYVVPDSCETCPFDDCKYDDEAKCPELKKQKFFVQNIGTIEAIELRRSTSKTTEEEKTNTKGFAVF